jgi:flavodoxin
MYIVYESRRGRARRAAEAVAAAAASHGMPTLVRAMSDAISDDILEAPALIVGCWVRVDTPFGGDPVRSVTSWIESLPELHGKPIGMFCTYTFFPHTFSDTAARTSEALAVLSGAIEEKGGKVVSSHSLHFQAFEKGAETLVTEVLDHTGN